MTNLIRLPKRFFIDHSERDLPTPAIVKQTKAHVWISKDDPDLEELHEDAEYYAYYGDDTIGLMMSARATCRAIEQAKKLQEGTWLMEQDKRAATLKQAINQ